MIDSHCHLHHCKLDEAPAIVQNAAESGLTHIIQVSTDPDSFYWGLEFTKEERAVPISLSAGLYPTRAEKPWAKSFEEIKKIVETHRICAVGEIGIDMYHDTSYVDEQIKMMRAQMELAAEHNLPVILHIRKSFEEVYKIAKEFEGKVTGVWHCFDGEYDEALKMMDLGYYISLSGLVTFNSAKELQEVAKKLPLEKLMIETDSPYLSPVPKRGKKNQPSHVVHTFDFLCELKDVPKNETEKILDHNTNTLFSL